MKLINRNMVKEHVLSTAAILRAHGFTRVAPHVLSECERRMLRALEEYTRQVVMEQPSKGKTIK